MPLPFTFAQLATLVHVADSGNFTRTAEELFLTQPAVTQQLHALERQLQVPLIEVVGRHPVLTEAGRFLVARARVVLGQADELERDMRAFAAAEIGEMRVGATLTIGTYVLPRLLARFQQERPQSHLHVTIANTTTIAAQVLAGTVSIALVEGEVVAEAFTSVPFQADELVLVTPPTHRLVHLADAAVRDLAGEPLVLREAGSGTRALAEAALRAAGIVPQVALAMPSGEGVLRAVEAGLGVTLISRLVAADAVAAGRLVIVPLADLAAQRVFQAITVRGRVQSPLVQAFLALLA